MNDLPQVQKDPRGTAFRMLLLFVLLSLTGIALIPRLQVDLNPKPKEKSLSLRYQLPDAKPELVEQEATSPLENALSTLSELEEIHSVSRYNEGEITMKFAEKTDMDFKRFEILALIRRIYPQLHEALSYPELERGTIQSVENASPLLIYTFSAAQASYAIAQQIEEQIKNLLSQDPDIYDIQVRGAESLQVKVTFDKDQLLNHDISLNDIQQQISDQFREFYFDQTTTEAGEHFFIKMGSPPGSIQELENLVIKIRDAYPIRLKDIAKLSIEEQKARSFYRINGLNSITLSVYGREGSNKIASAQRIKGKLEQLAQGLPQGYTYFLDHNDTESLADELSKIQKRAILSILILTALIFLANRNWRYLIILFTGILVTLCISSSIAYFIALDIHLYSLAGIAISFGLIVDNTIVMLDHLHRKKNKAIFLALLGASLTTVSALSLVLFLPSQDRMNLEDFALVIIITLMSSLLVALLYIPSLYHLLFRSPLNQAKKPPLQNIRRQVKWLNRYQKALLKIRSHRKLLVIILILSFGLPVFLLPANWSGEAWYHRWYNKSLGNEWYYDTIRPWVDKSLGGSLRLFVRNVYEKSGYRNPEKTKLFLNSRLPYGTTLEQMNELMQSMESYIGGLEGIEKFICHVVSPQYARIEISFTPEEEISGTPYRIKGKLIAKSLDWDGAQWNIYGVGRGFSAGGTSTSLPNFRVTMKGYNYDELERQAEVLADKLLRHQRIQEVNTNEALSWRERKSEQLVLNVDSKALTLRESNVQDITRQLQMRSSQSLATGSISLNDKIYPLLMEEKEAPLFSRYQLMEEALTIGNGKRLRLADVATLKMESISNSIHKENRQYLRVIGFDYFGNARFGNKYLDEVIEEMKFTLPPGYSIEKSTWQWGFAQEKRKYSLLLLLIGAIFFICAILFESLWQPFLIILCIPLTYIGLFLIFALFNFYFDQGGYAAFVLLSGLTVNAAIFILFDFNRSKLPHNKAVCKAAWLKAWPIGLTVLSTCFGLLPFILEGQEEIFWFSLAIGTIGGLAFSLLVSFLVLPVFLMKSETTPILKQQA